MEDDKAKVIGYLDKDDMAKPPHYRPVGLKALLQRIEGDDMPPDMMAVLLNHIPADISSGSSDGKDRDMLDEALGTRLEWNKLKKLSLD